MQILEVGVAGTMESSDIMVRIEPKETEGIELTLESSVRQQYGEQIKRVILDTLRSLGVTRAKVDAVDKGALDCAIEARVSVAAYRAAQRDDYGWKTGGTRS
jgi:citrate lyase subunit gamma (acyl carrier protein)